MYRIPPIYNRDIINALSIDDYPPLLVDLMRSKVNYNNSDPVEVDKLPEYFREYLFDFSYPLDEEFKENFEITFLEHYMERRIGFETYTSFKIHLKSKLNEIMPKYNKMLEGFKDLDFKGIKEIHNRTEQESGSSSNTNINDNRYSQLPQNEIDDVKDGTYLTDYTYNVGDSTGEANRETNEDINIIRVDNIEEYQKFLSVAQSIYTQIFKECDSLFFGLI